MSSLVSSSSSIGLLNFQAPDIYHCKPRHSHLKEVGKFQKLHFKIMNMKTLSHGRSAILSILMAQATHQLLFPQLHTDLSE